MNNKSRDVIDNYDPEAREARLAIDGQVCSIELTNFREDVGTINAHIAKYGIAAVISALNIIKIETLIFVCDDGICTHVCRATDGELRHLAAGDVELMINTNLNPGDQCREVVDSPGYEKYIGLRFPVAPKAQYLDLKKSSGTLKRQYPGWVSKPDEKLNRRMNGDEPQKQPQSSVTMLNQIFFGPPGTGKTYGTIEGALSIVDPDFLSEHPKENGKHSTASIERWQQLKQRFDARSDEERIRFVTFHQSFSYEDFVEGLRAQSNADNQIEYKVEDGVFKKLCDDARIDMAQAPYVLIIDEINRGNVSRIFGELITLIEPNKREGRREALSVQLPYSKRPFSVPANVYLIGTMNTVDRSLSGMDIALRRRFDFREMPPLPDLLDGVLVEEVDVGVDVGQLLRVMNERIELLLDRDHCLGHAYFMPLFKNPSLERLARIFKSNILPLLQEYFFEDWQRIQWVLNDHRKPAALRFVSAPKSNLVALFGEDVNVSGQSQRWTVNEDAFDQVGAYAGVINAQGR